MRDFGNWKAPSWVLKAHSLAALCGSIWALALAAFTAFITFMQHHAEPLDRRSIAISVIVVAGFLLGAWLMYLVSRYSKKLLKDRRP